MASISSFIREASVACDMLGMVERVVADLVASVPLALQQVRPLLRIHTDDEEGRRDVALCREDIEQFRGPARVRTVVEGQSAIFLFQLALGVAVLSCSPHDIDGRIGRENLVADISVGLDGHLAVPGLRMGGDIEDLALTLEVDLEAVFDAC